jgi:hypothetical protein
MGQEKWKHTLALVVRKSLSVPHYDIHTAWWSDAPKPRAVRNYKGKMKWIKAFFITWPEITGNKDLAFKSNCLEPPALINAAQQPYVVSDR